MSKKRKLKYILLLMLSAMILFGCSTPANYNNCPVYPVGGRAVGQELEKVPYQGYERFWEWLGRVDKLRQELELCK